MDGQISKIIQQNCDENTKISGKRNKQTISPLKMASSNSDSNTNAQRDFDAAMDRDGSTTKEKRLEEKLTKKCSKLHKLRMIRDEVLKENQLLKDTQNDMEKELEYLRQQREEKISKDYDATNSLEFSLLDLEEATRNFHKKFKIGKGGYGSVYKAVLHCTTVAIKVLRSKSNQGEREFYQEVNIYLMFFFTSIFFLSSFLLSYINILCKDEFGRINTCTKFAANVILDH
jgi:hypothetical protein